MDKESWSDFENYLIGRIDSLESKVHAVDKKLVALRTKMALVGSAFGLAGSAVYQYFQKKLN